jgi:hypothetical protein
MHRFDTKLAFDSLDESQCANCKCLQLACAPRRQLALNCKTLCWSDLALVSEKSFQKNVNRLS